MPTTAIGAAGPVVPGTMFIAIEPMMRQGDYKDPEQLSDGWTCQDQGRRAGCSLASIAILKPHRDHDPQLG